MTPNTEQIYGFLRILVPMALAAMSHWGWFPESVVGTLTEPVITAIIAAVTLGSLVWTLMAHRQKSMIIKTADMPEVRSVVTDPVTAVQIQHPGVVPAVQQEHHL